MFHCIKDITISTVFLHFQIALKHLLQLTVYFLVNTDLNMKYSIAYM